MTLSTVTCQFAFVMFSTSLLYEGAHGNQPEFSQPLKNVSVSVGRDATFSCVVSHLGGYRENKNRLQVGWVKADTKAIQAIHKHVITHNMRVSVSHTEPNTWNLKIVDVQEEDRGPYMCQINTDPMRSQIGFLEVTVPPEIIDADSSKDMMVREGSSVHLVCRAIGYPKPTVFWQREDDKRILLRANITGRGEVLNLTNIKRSDMGPYLCIANNSIPPIVSKRIMVEVHFSPVVHVPNQLISVPAGSMVSLICNVEASPKSIQYWTGNGGIVLIADKYYDVTETLNNYYVTNMTLTIKKFHPKNAGTYYCNAKNSLGEVRGHITVNELVVPTTKPPYTYDEIDRFPDDLNYYTDRNELSNHIPFDPDEWDITSPAHHDDRTMNGRSQNPFLQPPKRPMRPTKKPRWTFDSSSVDGISSPPMVHLRRTSALFLLYTLFVFR